MSVLKSTLEIPAITIPFKVRMEPYLIESVCTLARLIRDRGDLHSEITGLLFGGSEPGTRTVEALKAFDDSGTHSELARRERLEKAFKTAAEEAKNDPELSGFEIVGWFSFRNGSGLLSSDVAFHNQHFRKPEDLALIVWREGPSQMTTELYSKADSETLTAEDYRWGSVRLSADIRHMREPVELAMRVKSNEESYLRAYDSPEPETGFAGLIRKAEAASDRFFNLFSKPHEDQGNQAKIRGMIGDGRLPSRASWPPEVGESAINPQAYFNPYADATRRMQQPQAAQSAAAAGGTAWNAPAATPPVPVAPQQPQPPPPVPQKLPHIPEFRLRDPKLPLTAPLALPPSAPPLDLSAVGALPRTARQTQTSEIGGLPMLMHPPQTRKSFPWPLAVGLFIVSSAAVFAFLLLGGLQGDSGRLGQAFHAIFPGGELNMRVRTEDDRLRLTWNPRNRAVATATDGTLQIFDGPQHREVHLEGRQVSDGSVLYRPQSNDVTFRLEIRSEQGGGTSGSVRVLDGLSSQQQSALDVSAPKTAPSANPALSPEPALLSDSRIPTSSVKDPNAPTILRPGSNSATTPLSDIPYSPSSRSSRSASRYVTPQTIGTFPDATGTGSTINGWDTTPSKSRGSKQRFSRNAKPLVTSTGFVPPRPLMQVMPRTSSIPNGTIQTRTRVQVQVRVDATGKVVGTQLMGGPVNETISSAALAAARQWTFEPASSKGINVPADHTIVFEFRPDH